MKATGSGWCILAALAVCAALVLGAMTWLTRNVLASEHERSNAEARADLQERTRLALWRMDAAGAAIIVDESQRPVGNTTPPPPEAAESPVRMRFELSENGSLSASQGEGRLPQLKRMLRDTSEGRAVFTALCGSIELSNSAWEANKKEPDYALQQQEKQQQRDSAPAQAFNNEKERSFRGKAVDNQLSKLQNGGYQQPAQVAAPDPGVPGAAGRILRDAGPLRPTWIGGQLFLLRKIVWEGVPPLGGKGIEGVWLDPTVLGKSLLDGVQDLLPAAKLTPADSTSPDGMVLASFPFRLDPGEKPWPAAIPRPILISLAAGWAAAGLAILAAALLVRGIMRLSERRASFVSAVTHELRTPLTTFRLYSEMLEVGAVKEEKRADYLHVLTREADRLSHLVENVLAFSRIERGSARTTVREITAGALLDPMRERFASRLASTGMTLAMEVEAAAASRVLKVDTAAVEHILFNLVDNAAKYAGKGTLTIRVGPLQQGVAIRVSDQGPGVPASEHKRIFRAFHKSARDAAETRPGVGLGLALSRRLARSMGGDLTCDASAANGATFVLSLPS